MSAPKPRARILIIDDEKDLCSLLNDYLGARGYETAYALSGEEGLEKLRRSRFQLVLSDLRMPKLSGIQTLEAIKRLDPHIEVVLITAYGSVPTAIEALKLGAYDFIEKPIELERLVGIIEAALERRELRSVKGFEETTRAVFSTLRLSELVPLLTDLALNVAPAEDSFIALASAKRLELSAWSSVHGTPPRETLLGLARVVADHGERLRCLASAPAADPRFVAVPAVAEVRQLLAFPMWSQDAFLGVLGLCRTRGEDGFTARETHNFALFSALVTEAIRAARLYADLERKIEEVRRAEQKAIQNEKMAALGRIISGLAHELKNPLGGILLNSQLLRDSSRDPAAKESIRDIEALTRRCSDIIDNLLTYSRAAQTEKKPCRAADLAEAGLAMVKKLPQAAKVRITRDFGPVPKAVVNAVQIQQVLRNILENAMQAMPKGGTLTIRLRDTVARRETLQRWAAPGAAAVVRDLEGLREAQGERWDIIEVRDEGTGISPENLPYLFEPFFTTKGPGEGTGLGLYLSYEIVNANGGALWVSSPGRGRGTSVFVALPAEASADDVTPQPVPIKETTS